MKEMVFEGKILPDGHLFFPKELTNKKMSILKSLSLMKIIMKKLPRMA